MERILNTIVSRSRLQSAAAGGLVGFTVCSAMLTLSAHFRDILLTGEHTALILFLLLTVSLFGASIGDAVRKNADWIKTLTDWQNRDRVRPLVLPPYPDSDKLQLVLGERHDDDGKRIPEPSWFNLEDKALYTGILVVGDTGSGKTTCAGYPWLEKMLNGGLGGLILDAGGSYVRFVREAMKAAGREQDLIVIKPGGDRKYNPVYKPDMTSADLAGWLFMLIKNLQGTQKQSGTEAFWESTGGAYSTVIIDMCRLVDPQHLTLDILYKLNTDEKSKQKILGDLERELLAGTTPERQHRIKHILHYFRNEWAAMAANTRGSIPVSFNAAVQMFSSDYELAQTFCPHPDTPGIFEGFTNECFDTGKVVVVDMPLRKYPKSGLVVATLLKLDFQRGVLRRTEGRSESEVNKPVFLLVDEAQNYVTASQELGDTLYLAESRKNKPINIYMSQSIDSFLDAFGAHDACNVFFNNLRTKVFLSQEGPDSQKICAELCGKHTYYKKTITESEAGRESSVNFAAGGIAHEEVAVSKTVGYQEQDDYIFKPHDFRNLPGFVSVVSAFDGGVKLKPAVVYMKPLFVDGDGHVVRRNYETWFSGDHAGLLTYRDIFTKAV